MVQTSTRRLVGMLLSSFWCRLWILGVGSILQSKHVDDVPKFCYQNILIMFSTQLIILLNYAPTSPLLSQASEFIWIYQRPMVTVIGGTSTLNMSGWSVLQFINRVGHCRLCPDCWTFSGGIPEDVWKDQHSFALRSLVPLHGPPRMGRYILDIRIHDFVSKGAVECDWVPEAGVFKL